MQRAFVKIDFGLGDLEDSCRSEIAFEVAFRIKQLDVVRAAADPLLLAFDLLRSERLEHDQAAGL